jgi:hypothetical protein
MMTPADCCGACRSIHICRRRCGLVQEAGPSDMRPAPRSSWRAIDTVMAGAAILILFVLPLAGPFLDKVR